MKEKREEGENTKLNEGEGRQEKKNYQVKLMIKRDKETKIVKLWT